MFFWFLEFVLVWLARGSVKFGKIKIRFRLVRIFSYWKYQKGLFVNCHSLVSSGYARVMLVHPVLYCPVVLPGDPQQGFSTSLEEIPLSISVELFCGEKVGQNFCSLESSCEKLFIILCMIQSCALKVR